jgi:hypothetical protein
MGRSIVLDQQQVFRVSCSPQTKGMKEKKTHVLFPLPEASLLHLDLLRESLPQHLLLLLELGIVQLLDLGLAKLASLHLGLTVGLVVGVLGRVDKVEHVRSDEERSELAEVAVVLVVD